MFADEVLSGWLWFLARVISAVGVRENIYRPVECPGPLLLLLLVVAAFYIPSKSLHKSRFTTQHTA